jgi:hypothetical protein
VSTTPRLELRRRRTVGELLGEGFAVYGRHFGRFLGMAAAVVVPVQLIVSGFGLEQFGSRYDGDPSPAEVLVPVLASYLVTTPLVAVMTVHFLNALESGGTPSARGSILAGLEAFTPLFLSVLLAAAGVALGMLLFIVPGIYLAVRWYFVPQVVMAEGISGAAALARSVEIVKGSWWRVFGIGILTSLAVGIPAQLVQLPFEVAAKGGDSEAISLVGSTIAQVLAAPLIAIVSTLLYFDLRARREDPEATEEEPRSETPPDPPGLPPKA